MSKVRDVGVDREGLKVSLPVRFEVGKRGEEEEEEEGEQQCRAEEWRDELGSAVTERELSPKNLQGHWLLSYLSPRLLVLSPVHHASYHSRRTPLGKRR